MLLAMLVFLASCTGGVLTDSGSLEPRGKTVPPVVITEVVGIPPNKLEELKSLLAAAGGERDIGFVEGKLQSGGLSLAGEFRSFADGSGVRVQYQWRLRDADGVLMQTIEGEDNAGVPLGSDPWSAVSSVVLQRIAKRTAETMAEKLSSMGYATRLSALYVPPAEYFVMAGQNAEREIDFETLNGPGMANVGFDSVAPPEDPLLASASVEPLPNESEMVRSAAAAKARSEEEASRVASETAAVSSQPEVNQDLNSPGISAVAVIPVKGSPGGGDAELTAAMRKTLTAAGWPVVSKPGPNALTIVGRVNIAQKGASNQQVSVRWEVQSPDGKMLGDVKQANEVPQGALDSGWGPAAFAVAEAAATGIFDIVKRYQ